ncbi:MAG: DUF4091 domain-containing protein [Planctomycetota bacterium]
MGWGISITAELDKYRAGQIPGGERKHARIAAARNEWASAQVFISPPERAVVTLTGEPHLDWSAQAPRLRVEASNFTPVKGRARASMTPTLSFQGLVPDDSGTLTADPLLQAEHTVTQRGEICPIWVSVFVPAEATPGDYTSTISFHLQRRFQDEEKVGEVKLRLWAARTKLPSPDRYSFHLDLWQHPTSVARHHGVALWSDEHFRLLDAYLAPLGALGQKMITLVVSDVPWSGQNGQREVDYPSSVYEHSIVAARRTPAGRIACDFSRMHRYIAAAQRCGVGPELELFGLLGVWGKDFGHPIEESADNVRVRLYDEGSGTFRYITTMSDYEAYLRVLFGHLAGRKLLGRSFVAADEPSQVELFRKSLAVLKRIEPRIQVRVPAGHLHFMEEFLKDVKDWVPFIDCALAEETLAAKLRQRVKRLGGRYFWYVCCSPERPNTFLRSPLAETRLIPWLTRYFGFDGFLRWAYCCFPSDPWRRPRWNWTAGDMFFVYPGAHGGPVPTVRLEALRAGIQDYELLRLAEREGRKEAVKKAMRRVIKARSPKDIHPARKIAPDRLYALRDAEVAAARRTLLEL